MEKKADVFIKIEEYKDILDIVSLIQQKIKQARSTLEKINEIKNQENSEIEDWRMAIDEVEKKMEFVDRVLLEPE